MTGQMEDWIGVKDGFVVEVEGVMMEIEVERPTTQVL